MLEHSAAPEVWLGLDLGTQSVRAIAVSAHGDVVGAGSRRLSSRRKGLRHEQDPEQWLDALAAACRDALGRRTSATVRGAAVDGTSGTILLVDAAGRPLTPGLMYDDARALGEVELVNKVGAGVWAQLGYFQMQAAWGLPKLVWLVRNAGDGIRGVHLNHQNDFINRWLCGHVVAADMSNSLKTGYHLIEERWPSEVLSKLGVPEEILPEVVLSGTQLGTVCIEAAERTGIPEGTPVIAGMTDGCAAQIGAGALSTGSWNSVLGTTLVLKGVTEDLIRDPLGVVYSHRSPDRRWLPGGASSTGAAVLTRYFGGEDLNALSAQAAKREPTNVVAYPLSGRGERFPFTAPEAQSFVLSEPQDEIDHFAALLQGIAYIERLVFDYLDMLGAPLDGDLSLTGGAARNRYWCQLRADVLGRPVTLPENPETALGMAVLAASPGRKVAEVAAAMVRVREVIEPRRDRRERFLEPYVRLVNELERRGWVQPNVAEHARKRAAR